MAEGQGFEPWDGMNRRWFSRPVHSTTLPPLRRGHEYYRIAQKSQCSRFELMAFISMICCKLQE